VVNLAPKGSEIPKFGDLYAFRITTRSEIGKQTLQGDSAYSSGVVHCSKYLTDCSGRGCKVLNTCDP